MEQDLTECVREIQKEGCEKKRKWDSKRDIRNEAGYQIILHITS